MSLSALCNIHISSVETGIADNSARIRVDLDSMIRCAETLKIARKRDNFGGDAACKRIPFSKISDVRAASRGVMDHKFLTRLNYLHR